MGILCLRGYEKIVKFLNYVFKLFKESMGEVIDEKVV